jgi:tetratricopeptide (TPR) repeat protein
MGDPRTAYKKHKLELKLARQIPDRDMEGHALNGLGFDLADMDKTDQAIEHYEKALAIFGKVRDRMGKTYVLGNLAEAYMEKGRADRDPKIRAALFRKAIEYHNKELKNDEAMDYLRGVAQDLGGLGQAHTELGKPEEAIPYHRRALKIYEDIPDPKGEGEDLCGLGDAYAAQGKYQRAIEKYDEAIKKFREWKYQGREGDVLRKCAEALHAAGDQTRAIAQAEAALRIFVKNKLPEAKEVRSLLNRWRKQEKSNNG